MTHLDISDDLATEIAAARYEMVSNPRPLVEKLGIARAVVEGIFPMGIEDAVATHAPPTERAAIVDIIAILTFAIENGVTR